MNVDYSRNNGNWNVSRLVPLGACHTPDFDPLMHALLDAEEAQANYRQHVGRLPKPHMGNMYSLELQNRVNRAKQAVIEHLQKHPEILIIGSR